MSVITNPLAITYNGVAKSLPKINQDAYGSEYFLAEATGTFRVRIRHAANSPDKKTGVAYDRHNVELTRTIFGVAPAPDQVITTYLVIQDSPKYSTSAETGYAYKALRDFAVDAIAAELYGWQN